MKGLSVGRIRVDASKVPALNNNTRVTIRRVKLYRHSKTDLRMRTLETREGSRLSIRSAKPITVGKSWIGFRYTAEVSVEGWGTG